MDPERKMTRIQKLAPIWRTVVEVIFIIFLFYSNLLMGQYTGSGLAHGNGLWWAIQNVFSVPNFIIALITALIGHLFVTFLRRRF